jgi:hypothetical protein
MGGVQGGFSAAFNLTVVHGKLFHHQEASAGLLAPGHHAQSFHRLTGAQFVPDYRLSPFNALVVL